MFWTLDFLTAIQFRAETENHSDEAHLKCGFTSADSGLQLDLEIALSGVSAPNAFGVETSGDVIALIMKPLPHECPAFYGRCITCCGNHTYHTY
jgi:hypothetical protein